MREFIIADNQDITKAGMMFLAEQTERHFPVIGS